MGWSSSRDPMIHMELEFPTAEAAVNFAKANGLFKSFSLIFFSFFHFFFLILSCCEFFFSFFERI